MWQEIWSVFIVATHVKLTENIETNQFSWRDDGFIFMIIYLQKEKKSESIKKGINSPG